MHTHLHNLFEECLESRWNGSGRDGIPLKRKYEHLKWFATVIKRRSTPAMGDLEHSSGDHPIYRQNLWRPRNCSEIADSVRNSNKRKPAFIGSTNTKFSIQNSRSSAIVTSWKQRMLIFPFAYSHTSLRLPFDCQSESLVIAVCQDSSVFYERKTPLSMPRAL